MFTPQQSGNRDQQPVSLLFSPNFKAVDGQKHSPALGRSPSNTPTPFGKGQGFGGREQTPPSRRRSLTPASSIAKETPPPPPVDSLLDGPGFGGPSLAGWATQQEQHPDVGGVEDMSTSPIGGSKATPQAAAPAAAAARDYAASGRALREYESTWVTVFGFSQSDVPLVLREFGKCGDIVQFGTYQDGPHVNWLHINYAVSSSYGNRSSLYDSSLHRLLSFYYVIGSSSLIVEGILHTGFERTALIFCYLKTAILISKDY